MPILRMSKVPARAEVICRLLCSAPLRGERSRIQNGSEPQTLIPAVGEVESQRLARNIRNDPRTKRNRPQRGAENGLGPLRAGDTGRMQIARCPSCAFGRPRPKCVAASRSLTFATSGHDAKRKHCEQQNETGDGNGKTETVYPTGVPAIDGAPLRRSNTSYDQRPAGCEGSSILDHHSDRLLADSTGLGDSLLVRVNLRPLYRSANLILRPAA